MTVTSGFFNSISNDRLYNADQMSSMFEGMITDGVYQYIGQKLNVIPNVGMSVKVRTGRAWFDKTWTNNDSDLVLNIDASSVTFHRYDIVVLEINKTDAVRANTIKVVKGTPSASPVLPALTNTDTVKQYPLANIYIDAGRTTIISASITNRVGTVDCPYAKGILRTVDTETIENLESSMDARMNTIEATNAQISNNQLLITSTGSSNAYIVTYAIAPTSYTNTSIIMKPNFTNTDASTIKANSLGIKTIKKYINGAKIDLYPKDIVAGDPALLMYDGEDYILTNPRNQMVSKYIASENVLLNAPTERSTTSNTYVTAKSFRITKDGTIRIKGQYHGNGGDSWAKCYVRIVNGETGAVIGSETQSESSATYQDFIYSSIPVFAGDLIRVQFQMVGYGPVYIRNVTVCTTDTFYQDTMVVID